jgi:hypothetical protein
MSGSYRQNEFAFFGLILFVFAVPILAYLLSHSANKQDTTYAEKKCAEQQLRYADSETLADIQGVQSIPDRERGEQTEDGQSGEPNWCDVAAQQSMANSARGAEHAAWVSAVLTFFGVVLIFFTLFYTARTLDEARATTATAQETVEEGKLATEAANRSAHVQEESLRRLERPYLFIDIKSVLGGYSDGRRSVVYKIANWGRTPAILNSVYLRLAFSENMISRFRGNGMPIIRRDLDIENYEVIAPNESTAQREIFLEEFKSMSPIPKNDIPRIWLHVLFRYQDAAGEFFHEEILMQCNEGGRSFRIVRRHTRE